jgi:hypothetical protein
VQEQVGQLDRLGRRKPFFSPHLADLIVSGGAEDPLKTHRREIAVVFLDLRGFTAFAEAADPEEVMNVLREYHAAMGTLILAHEGTLERFTGDGIMIFFNDPIVVPIRQASSMAVAMQSNSYASGKWQKQGHALGSGSVSRGVTQPSPSVSGRWDYGAISNVIISRRAFARKPGPDRSGIAPRISHVKNWWKRNRWAKLP